MRELFIPLKRLLLQLFLLLIIYSFCRCCFTLLNHNRFEDLSLGQFFRLCYHSFRYDISSVLRINAPYILLLLLPLPWWRLSVWEKIVNILFIISNSLAFLFEVGDWAYFPYNFKRATGDLFKVMGRKGDFIILVPRFLLDYWYLLLFLIVLIIVFVRLNKIIRRKTSFKNVFSLDYDFKTALKQSFIFCVVVIIGFIGIRGGLQRDRINLHDALSITESRYVGIVVNTPFSILNTLPRDPLAEYHFYNDSELRQYINPIKCYSDKTFHAKNVVLIIVESFSKEFTKIGARKSYTPFIDSLMNYSLVCTNAYANALHSAEGVPAVIAGIPSLMEEPFLTGVYSTNKIDALPKLLLEKNYNTAFYHGATNGTMGFDVFCRAAGYQRYYGRAEYNNEKDYDGNWGIRDEPFLQYFLKGINTMKQPFLATVFTLSSHPPYNLPAKYLDVLPKGKLPIYQCIAYTDMALRKFFQAASKEPWYDSTLFVITADHCSPMAGDKYYRHNLGEYSIPILFYAPSDTALQGNYTKIVQQLDIMPSVLDYLGFEKSFYAFGNSIFRKNSPRFVINEISDSYQWLMEGCLLKATDTMPVAMFAYPSDSACKCNILQQKENWCNQKIVPYFKAFMQEYHDALIHNKQSAR